MLRQESQDAIDSQIEARIRNWEETLDPGAQVIVEGGHFTVNVYMVTLPAVAIHKPDTLFLLDLEPGAPDPPFQLFRARNGHEGNDLSVVEPSEHEIVDLRNWPGLTQVRELTFRPSPTEERSFRHAVATVHRLRQRVARVVPALFIGDIGHSLPAALKEFIQSGRLLPGSYRRELEHQDLSADLCLFLESVCRNRGKEWVLDRSKTESSEAKEEIYDKYGYGIFTLRNIYSLVGDFFITEERFPLIPLTKNERNTPTCALILAGKYLKMARENFTRVLAIYDKRDDAEIRVKNRDGMTIAAYILGDHPLECTLVTVDHLSREPVMSDHIGVREITGGERRCKSFRELVTTARRRTPLDGAAAEECSQTTCSVPRL